MKQSHLDLLVVFLAECIGTGLLVFIGCMGAVPVGEAPDLKHPSHLSISLAFGLAVMLIINIFGMVTGAHLNPVVTLGAYIYKLVSIPVSPFDDALRGRLINIVFDYLFQTVIAYVLGQMLGGYLGYGLLRVIVTDRVGNDFCVSKPSLDSAQAFGLEFMITAILMMVYCGVVDPRNANHHGTSLRRPFSAI